MHYSIYQTVTSAIYMCMILKNLIRSKRQSCWNYVNWQMLIPTRDKNSISMGSPVLSISLQAWIVQRLDTVSIYRTTKGVSIQSKPCGRKGCMTNSSNTPISSIMQRSINEQKQRNRAHLDLKRKKRLPVKGMNRLVMEMVATIRLWTRHLRLFSPAGSRNWL